MVRPRPVMPRLEVRHRLAARCGLHDAENCAWWFLHGFPAADVINQSNGKPHASVEVICSRCSPASPVGTDAQGRVVRGRSSPQQLAVLASDTIQMAPGKNGRLRLVWLFAGQCARCRRIYWWAGGVRAACVVPKPPRDKEAKP